MRLEFYLSGTLVFEAESDCVPPVGSEVIFAMQTYKKGMKAGTVVAATISDDIPPSYDFTRGGVPVVSLDVDSFRTLSEG
jgi:hypothetical protein